jgi:hypothetical protein
MGRTEFLKIIIRYILLGILAVVTIITGSRAVSASDCSKCPGNGRCSGESDCSTFLSENR